VLQVKDPVDQLKEKFGDLEVETLFKVEAPFTPAGEGFNGLLVIRKDDGNIHCHECGKWFKMLGPHLFKKHEMKSDEYRYKYGLPLEQPLCTRRLSSQRSDVALRPEHVELLRKIGKKYRLKGKALSKKLRKVMKYANNNAAHKNKHGACEDQMLRRYLIVCDIIGKMAGQNDLTEYDNALRGLIGRSKHKTLNGFRKYHKLTTIARAPISTETHMLACLRKFYHKYGRVPRSYDFKGHTPSNQAIRNRFGGWHRALLDAGFSAHDLGKQKRRDGLKKFQKEG
jgi:hypothetical protein